MSADQQNPLSVTRPTLPRFVSPVWYELSEAIEKNPKFANLSKGMLDLVFCVAYTKYCRRKKTFIAKQITENGNKVDPNTIAHSFIPFAHAEYYESLSDEAHNVVTFVFDSRYQPIIRDITSALDNKIRALHLHNTGFKAIIRDALFHLGVLTAVAIIPTAGIFIMSLAENHTMAQQMGQVGDAFIGIGEFIKARL